MSRSTTIRLPVVAAALLPAAGALAVTGDPLAVAVALALGPIAAGVSWAVAHRTIAARDERLAAAADRLAAGDLAARAELRRGGAGRIGRALDAVAARLVELERQARPREAAGEARPEPDGER